MIKSTLCYIKRNNSYLMMFRNHKSGDPNLGKWIGVGGKFKNGETADDCMLREVKEETGISLVEYHFHGIIHFVSDICENEDMYLYSGIYRGKSSEKELQRYCDEGELRWIDADKIMSLNLWQGDKYFLKKLLAGEKEITMTLEYQGKELVKVLF